MINSLIENIKSIINDEISTGALKDIFKNVEYANDLNNIAAVPAVRFYLANVSFPANTAYNGALTASFSFCFYSSNAGGNIQQMQQKNSALLLTMDKKGVIPLLKKLPAYTIKTGSLSWKLSNFEPLEFFSGNKGTGCQFGIITTLNFETFYK